ncbi:hypothetical protein [Pseudorhizobium flavum]|uniref:hypothetical protein n=1 Tax=Pseudorhizobium flavum TaxID=1335061 RepID=UPI00376F625B
MFIDEKRVARRFAFLRSPFSIAIAALAACVAMMLVLIEGPMGASELPVTFSAVQAFRPISAVLDPRLAFIVTIGGFLLMAGGGFILSRRSFRDVLKAENERGRD